MVPASRLNEGENEPTLLGGKVGDAEDTPSGSATLTRAYPPKFGP